MFRFPCLSPEGTLLDDLEGVAMWARGECLLHLILYIVPCDAEDQSEQPEVSKAERTHMQSEELSVHRS